MCIIINYHVIKRNSNNKSSFLQTVRDKGASEVSIIHIYSVYRVLCHWEFDLKVALKGYFTTFKSGWAFILTFVIQ